VEMQVGGDASKQPCARRAKANGRKMDAGGSATVVLSSRTYLSGESEKTVLGTQLMFWPWASQRVLNSSSPPS
jgi:hypothetical protein